MTQHCFGRNGKTSNQANNVTETSSEKEPITRKFFNNDVIFEEVMLPVQIIYFADNGNADNILKYAYDAAGNKSKCLPFTYEYDYNTDGTYNSVFEYYRGKLTKKIFYDKNGYCIEMTSKGTTTNYEYEFDETGRLIRKTEICGDKKEGFEYTYDETGRLYEEINNTAKHGCIRYRHEYIGNSEKIYYFRNYLEEEKLWKIIERDENENIIKETVNVCVQCDCKYIQRAAEYEKLLKEYKYNNMNRLIYKKDTRYLSDDEPETDEFFYDENGRILKEIYTYVYGTKEPEPHKETVKYSYNDGNIISQEYNINGTLLNETKYAMIPKIKTDIEYKNYNEVNP